MSNGSALPSPFSSRPQAAQVAGMNWAMPCAPTGETAASLKCDSWKSCAASTLSVTNWLPAAWIEDSTSATTSCGTGTPPLSVPPVTPPGGTSLLLTLPPPASAVSRNAATSISATGTVTGALSSSAIAPREVSRLGAGWRRSATGRPVCRGGALTRPPAAGRPASGRRCRG